MDDAYLKQLESSVENLTRRLEECERLIGVGYDVCIFDDRLSDVSSQKLLDYLVSFGWVLKPKKKVDEQKRRWEYLQHPVGFQSQINFNNYEKTSLGKEFVYDPKAKRATFQFPYKPLGMTYLKKYGMETIEAYNKLNIVLKKQAVIEDKPLLKLFDELYSSCRE